MAARLDPLDVLNRESEPPDLVLRYSEHDDGLIDVFFPPTLGRPGSASRLVFFVHGGFWRAAFDRTHARPLANALTRRGFVVALPEYRRGSGAWPFPAYDVEAALAAAPGLIEATAPGRVDAAAPVVVAGHSAGGHLALWAGLRAGSGRVRHVVALAPVSDPVEAARTGMGGEAAQALLGGVPDAIPDRYADADPLAALPSDVPVTIIQGTEDREVPVAHNRAVVERHGLDAGLRYVELDGVGHFALIDPLTPTFQNTVMPTFAS